jgi:hypothetical protein
MANYTKSFNFRNGVQVDDSNFIVNSVGLVGIGTTKPEKKLDVRGNAIISGITSLSGTVISGVVTAGNIKIDPVTGIVTATKFVGDASGLQNIVAIATEGFIKAAGTLSTTAKVGIGSETPVSQLDVFGDTKIVGFTTLSGITTSIGKIFLNDVEASGVTTTVSLETQTIKVSGLSTFSGNIDVNANLDVDGNTLLRQNFRAAGFSTFAGIDVNGNADFSSGVVADTLKVSDLTNNRVVIAGASGEIEDSGNFTFDGSNLNVVGHVESDTVNVSGVTTTNTLEVSGTSILTDDVTVGAAASVGIGSTVYFPDDSKAVFGNSGDLSIFHDSTRSVISDQGQGSLTFLSSASYFKSASDNTNRLTILAGGVKAYSANVLKFETVSTGASVYNQLNVASLGGGTSGLSSHYGALRYGDEGGSEYSTRRSLDLINTDSGNINYYLNINNLSNSGDFHWHKGTSNQLMTLTSDGSLGIGVTIPLHKLHVAGISTLGGNTFIGGNLSVLGSLTSQATINATEFNGEVDGNLTGNVNATSGLSTFFNIKVTSKQTEFSGLGIGRTCATTNLVDIIGPSGLSTSRIFITTDGSIGIGTNRIDDTININAVKSKATLGSLGIGKTNPLSAVDFSDAGKDALGDAANRMYMYPPKLNNSQKSNLVGVTAGAMIYNTSADKLQVYDGTTWQNCF